jgi:hypothetical protein
MKTLADLKKTSFEVPASVRKAAAKGLELRKEFGRGGLSIQEAAEQGIWSGVATARELIKGRIGLRLLKRMKAYHARHAIDAKAKGNESRGFWGNDSNPSAGYIADLIWGGSAGEKWVNGILKNISD